MAAPSMSAAVKRANQSPPSDGVKPAPSRLFETDREATGIIPSSTPSKTSARNAATSTATRARRWRVGTLMRAIFAGP